MDMENKKTLLPTHIFKVMLDLSFIDEEEYQRKCSDYHNTIKSGPNKGQLKPNAEERKQNEKAKRGRKKQV